MPRECHNHRMVQRMTLILRSNNDAVSTPLWGRAAHIRQECYRGFKSLILTLITHSLPLFPRLQCMILSSIQATRYSLPHRSLSLMCGPRVRRRDRSNLRCAGCTVITKARLPLIHIRYPAELSHILDSPSLSPPSRYITLFSIDFRPPNYHHDVQLDHFGILAGTSSLCALASREQWFVTPSFLPAVDLNDEETRVDMEYKADSTTIQANLSPRDLASQRSL